MSNIFTSQAYDSPLSKTDKKLSATFNPFIDLIQLPISNISDHSKSSLQLKSLEFGHSHLALEGHRMVLKELTRKIYEGIYDFITQENNPPLKIPTFTNAPGLQALNFELNAIFESFEPVEEIITLARTVSIFKKNDDPFGLSNYNLDPPESYDWEKIEYEGMKSLMDNFGEPVVKLYNSLMKVSDYHLNIIFSIAHVAMSERFTPLILYDNDFLVEHETDERKKCRKENFSENWSDKVLLDMDGFKKIGEYYGKSEHNPLKRLAKILDFLEEKKTGSWEKEEFEEAIYSLGFFSTSVSKFQHLAQVFKTGTVFHKARMDFTEEERIIRHYEGEARALSFILRANRIIEQRDIFKDISSFSEDKVEFLLMELEREGLEDFPLADELRRNPLTAADGDKRLRSTVLADKNDNYFPERLFQYYKPLYLWESIRLQFHDWVAGSDLKIPKKFKDDKIAQDLFELLRKNTELDGTLINDLKDKFNEVGRITYWSRIGSS